MNTTLKKIVAEIAVAATIVGGLVVGFVKPEPLTWNELNALTEVYNYEIKQLGGNVELRNVNQGNFLDLLNAKIQARPVSENVVKIAGEDLTKDQYVLLRSGLIEKYEQKSLIERIIN